MTDPASLNLSVTITGLSTPEATWVLAGMPARAQWFGRTTQPALGGRRHEITVNNLSVQGAIETVGQLRAYLESLETPDGAA